MKEIGSHVAIFSALKALRKVTIIRINVMPTEGICLSRILAVLTKSLRYHQRDESTHPFARSIGSIKDI